MIFKLVVYFSSPGKIIVVDIDNTVSNTWPTLNMNFKNERERLRSLPIFPGMKMFLLTLIKDSRNHILFLSARKWTHLSVTYGWLKKHRLVSSPFQLFLVSEADEKIKFYR